MAVSLRTPTPEDLPRLVAWSEEWRVWHAQPAYASGNLKPLGEHDCDYMLRPPAVTRIILREGQPVGYIVGQPHFHEMCLLEIVVADGYRRQGVGGRALQQYLREAVPAGVRVFLEVRMDNIPAIRMYKRAGFRIDHPDRVIHHWEMSYTR